MMRIPSFARCLPGAVLLLVLVTGCRTYGGYGAEDEIPQQMQQATERFAGALDRAQSDLEMLTAAADQNSDLAPLADQYRNLVEEHEAVLEDHRRVSGRAQGSDAYRALHRGYGTIIAEQRLIQTWYRELHTRIQNVVSGQPAGGGVSSESRYVITPSYYDRAENQQLTMQAALQAG